MTTEASPGERSRDDSGRGGLTRARETVLVVVLVALGFVLRLPTLSGPFDREFEGFQGASFTAMVINFERLGIGAFGGYGVMNVDLPTDPATTPYLYANHPPTVNLLIWSSLTLFGPAGWNEQWRDDLPPTAGFERAARLPFFALGLLTLVALWWSVRQASGPRRAVLALGVLVALPISILYGSLINYENAYLPWTLFAFGFHARWLKHGATRDLLAMAAFLSLAGAITFGPAFFVAPLVLHTLLVRGFRRAVLQGALATAAVLAPLVLHALWVKHVLPAAPAEGVLTRVGALVSPAFDGTMPIADWLTRNVRRAAHFASLPLFALAVAGAVVSLAGRLVRRSTGDDALELCWGLLGGAALLFFGFYRHTFDGAGLYDSQTVFLVNLGPALACLAALALERLGRIVPSRSMTVSLAALLLVGALAQARTNEVARIWRAPGPNDQPPAEGGPEQPLPPTNGARIRAVLPARSIGLVPRELSLTPATSLYAWRTLIPVDRATFPHAIAVVRDVYGLGDLPRYLLLPVRPTERLRAIVDQERASLRDQGRTPIAASEHWEVWPLAPR